jgi:hypothetical protein
VSSTLLLVTIYLIDMNAMGFGDVFMYLDFSFHNQSLTMFLRTYMDQMNIQSGYFFNLLGFCLEVLGYYLGGILMYCILTSKDYCRICNRYFKNLPVIVISGPHMEDVKSAFSAMALPEAYQQLVKDADRYKVIGVVTNAIVVE